MRIFEHCPLLSAWSHHHHTTAFDEFLAYKIRVPVRGAILLNEAMDEIVLVKGWKKGASWSFPRGKINKDEKDLDCAVREVYEETGFDVRAAGLADPENEPDYIELPMREQNMRLYMIRGVSKDAHFAPRTRKEISKIEWYKLSELPTLKKKAAAGQLNGPANKFYMVAPFLGPLRRWIAKQRKLDAAKNPNLAQQLAEPEPANGKSPSIEPQVPSDLPEVSNPEEASLHLKRLLNIGTVPAPQVPQQPEQSFRPRQPSSTALLSLLRQGTETSPKPTGPPTSFHPDRGSIHPLPQSFNWQSNFPNSGVLNPPPGLAAPSPLRMSPAQYPVTAGNEFSQPFPPGLGSRFNPPQQGPYQSQPITQHARYQPQPQIPTQDFPQNPTTIPPRFTAQPVSSFPEQPPRQVPAPYQRTGDPEFAELGQGDNRNMPSVPPANKLPLPKLTSHSMALLNVFKGDTSKKGIPALSSPGQFHPPQQMETGRKADHQKSLLNLLKNQQSKTSKASQVPATRAELGNAPTPTAAPAPKIEPVRILRKETPSQPQREPQRVIRHRGDKATLSGPLNLPNFEAAKSSRRQPPRSPRTASPPKGLHRVKAPTPVPNITILPRPSQEKKTSPVQSPTHAPGPTSGPVPVQAPRPQPRNVRLADFAKPFKPKILRRPEGGNIEAYLPTHTVTVSAFTKEDQTNDEHRKEQEAQQEESAKTVGFDRRPSQTVEQKEALLSLFGKASAVAPGAGLGAENEEKERELVSPLPASPPPRSMITSPLEGYNLNLQQQLQQQQPAVQTAKPTSPAEISGDETGAKDKGKARVTSPDDKAFLLGYLQGVAKGKQ